MHRVESIGMIRLRLAEGMSQRAIARELGVSRKTIRKVQRTGATNIIAAPIRPNTGAE